MGIKIKENLDKFTIFLLFIVVFTIYFSTMSRSVNEFDSGELAATQAFWGIPHPTSYPLFNLVGFLFSKIPLPIDTIIKLNLLPVLWNTITILFLFLSIRTILENISVLSNKKEIFSNRSLSKSEILLVSFISSLSFAWSVTFWIQATKIEVYSFQIFLTSIIVYCAIKILINLEQNELSLNVKKYWRIIAIFLGFGFSNHLMTVYLLPALIYLLIITKTSKTQKIKIFVIVFMISFSIATFFYLVMMFRAQTNPPYVFGEPTNIQGLVNTVLGKDYSQFMFSGMESVKKQSSKFLTVLSLNFNRTDFIGGEFSFNIIFIFSGLFLSAIILRKFFYFVFLIIITSLFFAFNYSIPDINEYFLVVFLLFTTLISIFIYKILLLIDNKIYKVIFLMIASSFTISQLFFNYEPMDRSSDKFTESYSKAVLNSLPKNSTLLSIDWDYIISPAIYIQKVEKFRDDIEIIIPTWLEKRWYKPEIKKKFSNILEFLDREYYISFDIVRDMILKNKFRVKENTFIIPDLLTFKVVKDNNYHPIELRDINIKFNKRLSDNEKYYRQLICWILEERAKYELSFEKYDKVNKLISIIKSLDPNYKLSI
uniref:DUF2723 domain-containing protein n=1 Tax=Ignavibacterium album TaxID=591197 RepID=A0A7V3E8E9_9BACT